jgi:hypothetical protein
MINITTETAEIIRKIVEVSLVVADGYRSEGMDECDEHCAIAANNTGVFILQALGLTEREISALYNDARSQSR